MKQKELVVTNSLDKDKKNYIKFMIIAVILIAIFGIALAPRTLQNDTFYTIKIGEHIEQHGIDMKDPFSWHEGLAYTYPHWLYDFITYQIYNAFGMDGIYIVTCILSAILGISIYLVNQKLSKNQIISFILTMGAMYLIRDYIAARAQLVTFIFFILQILFIENFLETKKKRYAVGLIIIPILIANLHLAVFPFYFVLFLPYIGEYVVAVVTETILYAKCKIKRLKRKIAKLEKKLEKAESDKEKIAGKIEELKNKLKTLEERVDRIKIKRAKELQDPYKIKLVKNDAVKWLIVIMIICAFTGLLTPLGTTPYTYLVKTMQGNTTENINEHAPMVLAGETEMMCVFIIFFAILIFTKTKIRLSDLFMIGGLCYLMIASRRQITMFVIMGSVVLNRLLVNLLESYETKENVEKMLKKCTGYVGVVVITVITLWNSVYFIKQKEGNEYIDKSSYPVDACDYIIENIDLGKAKFFNEYNYGSYMLFRGIPVFIDSRADLYAPEFSGKEDDIFMDFIDTSSIGEFYENTFKKYNITHVILYENSKMSMIIDQSKDQNYKELYRDDYFVIYERLNCNETNQG